MLLFPLIESRILLILSISLFMFLLGWLGLLLDSKYTIWFSRMINRKDSLV